VTIKSFGTVVDWWSILAGQKAKPLVLRYQSEGNVQGRMLECYRNASVRNDCLLKVLGAQYEISVQAVGHTRYPVLAIFANLFFQIRVIEEF
jgi:hypothetical protein